VKDKEGRLTQFWK